MCSPEELHAELLNLLDKQLEMLELSVFVPLTGDEQSEFQARQERINELSQQVTFRAAA